MLYEVITESKGSGAIPKEVECFTDNPVAAATLGNACVAQRAREDAAGGFWTASNANPEGEAYFV